MRKVLLLFSLVSCMTIHANESKDMMCQRGATITVEANSTLIVGSNCHLRNAVIHLKPQSHLIVRNGGEIYLRKNHSLEIPRSATADISEGAIFNRPY